MIDDQIVAALSRESLDRVWAPKAAGALRLHAATAGRELDWWVGFSSTSSLLGSPGQGAYAAASAWLDALVAWRRASGLPATAINWGQWSDVGVARSLTFSALDPITPAEGIEALESVLAGDLSRVGVARLRLDRAPAAFPGDPADSAISQPWPRNWTWTATTTIGQVPTRFGTWIPPRPTESSPHVWAHAFSAVMGYPDDAAIDASQPLTELGMDSLMAVRIRNTVRGDFGVEPPVALLLQGASLTDLTADLIRQLGLAEQDNTESANDVRESSPAACRSAAASRGTAKGRRPSVTSGNESFSQSASLPPNAIAVVGMAGRFPGADSVSAFWDNLRRGEESIVTLSEESLLAAGIGEKVLANHAYVRRAALMDGIDEFDADFFGFTPQAARTMDPQHRLFLQMRLACAGRRRLRPGGHRRFSRRVRNEHDQRIPAAQPDVAPGPERDHRAGRHIRDGQPVVAERQGLSRDAGGAPVQPAWSRAVGADGVLVVSGRSSPGLSEHSER